MANSRYFFLNGYRLMWAFVLFDLPVVTKIQRKRAAKFRKDLLKEGFFMAQLSVYYKPLAGKEALESVYRYVRSILPPEGHVEILWITDKQYENIVTFTGTRESRRKNPDQLLLF